MLNTQECQNLLNFLARAPIEGKEALTLVMLQQKINEMGKQAEQREKMGGNTGAPATPAKKPDAPIKKKSTAPSKKKR